MPERRRTGLCQEPGPRQFAGVWEFQAVLRGVIHPTGPVFESDWPEVPTLWAFGPHVSHGWAGVPNRPGMIAVFHFSHVSPLIGQFVGEQGWTSVPLVDSGVVEFELRAVMYRLAILLCSPLVAGKRNELIVNRAETILATETERLIPISKLAERVGTSVTTLRRAFGQERGYSPRRGRERVVMRQARHELASGSETGSERVIDVALGCGYADNSGFTKAHRRFWKVTPLETRSRARNRADRQRSIPG